MIVAVKDDLQIEVTVEGEKVNIELPDMRDVIFLWESWIEQEKISAENFLRTHELNNPYRLLADYFKTNGWEVIESGFGKS